MKPKLGYIGLGLMGSPMVDRLLLGGYDVIVWNRTRQKIFPAIIYQIASIQLQNENLRQIQCKNNSKMIGKSNAKFNCKMKANPVGG